jgi:hypothetical protein
MIPEGATHSHEFYGDVSYWKLVWDRVSYNVDPRGEEFYVWAYWDRDKWVKEPTVCTRGFVKLDT